MRFRFESIKAVAALCFDKDAARALLKSLSDNVPILGGSALVDSLDALQRCEDAVVRKWAIKVKAPPPPVTLHSNPSSSNSHAFFSPLQPPKQINRLCGSFCQCAWLKMLCPLRRINGWPLSTAPRGRLIKAKKPLWPHISAEEPFLKAAHHTNRSL